MALSAVAVLGTSNAVAAEPAACADPQVLADIRLSYRNTSASLKLPALTGIATPVDSGLVDDAPALKKKPGSSRFGRSRFCDAQLLLADGQEDRVYYRIDALTDGTGHGYMLSPCFGAMARYLSSTVEIICAPNMPLP